MFQGCACQSFAHGATRLFYVRDYRLACRHRPRRAPRALQLIPADATGKADASVVAVNHAAVSARKSQQRHQTSGQSPVQKMRFEAKQIGGLRRRPRRVLRGQMSGFPRAVSRDSDSRPQLLGLAILLVDGLTDVSGSVFILVLGQLGRGPRLKDMRSGRGGAVEQHRIQLVPAQRAAPSVAGASARHLRSHGMIAGKQPDLTDLRPSKLNE